MATCRARFSAITLLLSVSICSTISASGGEDTAASVAAAAAARSPRPGAAVTPMPSARRKPANAAAASPPGVNVRARTFCGSSASCGRAAGGQPALVDLQRADRGHVAGGHVAAGPAGRQARPGVQRRVVAAPHAAGAAGPQRPGGLRGQPGQRGGLRVVRRPAARPPPASGRRRRPGRCSPRDGPATTRVANRACGPSTDSAATAVAILVVDAGAKPEVALLEYSTWPGGQAGDQQRRRASRALPGQQRGSAAARPAGVTAARRGGAGPRPAPAARSGGSPRPRPAAATCGTSHEPAAAAAGARRWSPPP